MNNEPINQSVNLPKGFGSQWDFSSKTPFKQKEICSLSLGLIYCDCRRCLTDRRNS